DGGATIRVPRDLVAKTRVGIANQDLPLKGTIGFELFSKSDLGLTEQAQRINYQRALQGELARTIMGMDSVDFAPVHLAIPEPTYSPGAGRPPRAAVSVQTRPGRQLSADTVRGIQRLVAATVPDLNVADVVVLDQAGRVVSGDSAAEDRASISGAS